MPRKKKQCEEKSTVLAMRDDCDWGRILYDACYIFNKSFADYLVEHARQYDEGNLVVKDANKETTELLDKRNKLIGEREELHEAVRTASARKTDAFRFYAKSLPIGEVVSKWRKSNDSGERDEESFENYKKAINERNEHNELYHLYMQDEKRAIANERNHIDSNLFMTRTINRRVKNIAKLIEKHRLQLNHGMSEDVKPLHDLIVSEGQAERLMAVCVNILNTYSEREFITLMGVLDREHIAEKIYDFFSKFEHNYDFIAGCYDVDEHNNLVLKPIDMLKDKIYNGYYFTIRGYVQRAYASIRFERFNIESADANWENEKDNGNHGIDRKKSSESENNGLSLHSTAISEQNVLDEGTKECWIDCNKFLSEHINMISEELAKTLSTKFPRNPYYNSEKTVQNTGAFVAMALKNIGSELLAGNMIGNKFKHIVLDSMSGAESNKEWRQNVNALSGIVAKYIKMFFLKERCQNNHEDEFWCDSGR